MPGTQSTLVPGMRKSWRKNYGFARSKAFFLSRKNCQPGKTAANSFSFLSFQVTSLSVQKCNPGVWTFYEFLHRSDHRIQRCSRTHPDAQIKAVKSLVFNEIPMNPHPFIHEGDRVRIIRGPLREMEGLLLEKKNRYTFILSIDLIQQSVACEIEAADVEKI